MNKKRSMLHGDFDLIRSQTSIGEIRAIEGLKIVINSEIADDPISNSIRQLGSYDDLATKLWQFLIKKGSVALDIGAQIGYYTMLFAKLVGPSGKVFAFEPDTWSSTLIEESIKINEFKNIEIIQKGVSDKKKTSRLFQNPGNRGDNRILWGNQNWTFLDVEMTSLDEFFKGREIQVDFVKIDTQGCEPYVLKGMSRILKQEELLIILEFWPAGFTALKVSSSTFAKRLETEYGLEIYELGAGRIVPSSAGQLMSAMKRRDMKGFLNVLCLKGKKNKEKIEAFMKT